MRGADKLMEQVGGRPLLRTMAIRALNAGAAGVRVVLAKGQDTRRNALAGLATEIVQVPAGQGMAASIAAGVNGVNGPALVMLADMPGITADDLRLLCDRACGAPHMIHRAATATGVAGHPVVFPADLVPLLRQLGGDQGARHILAAHTHRTTLVQLSGNRALVDLDTPEDWVKWRENEKP